MRSEQFSIRHKLRRLTRSLADSSPILRFTIHEHSMQPGLAPGDEVLAIRWIPVKEGNVVVARRGSVYLIKRVKQIEDGDYYLLGDNPRQSIDSRRFGPLKRSDIVGVVIHKLHR